MSSSTYPVRRPALTRPAVRTTVSDEVNRAGPRATHIVKSTQGLMRMAPEGSGYPSSRRYIINARQRPPPALSPAKTCPKSSGQQLAFGFGDGWAHNVVRRDLEVVDEPEVRRHGVVKLSREASLGSEAVVDG